MFSTSSVGVSFRNGSTIFASTMINNLLKATTSEIEVLLLCQPCFKEALWLLVLVTLLLQWVVEYSRVHKNESKVLHYPEVPIFDGQWIAINFKDNFVVPLKTLILIPVEPELVNHLDHNQFVENAIFGAIFLPKSKFSIKSQDLGRQSINFCYNNFKWRVLSGSFLKWLLLINGRPSKNWFLYSSLPNKRTGWNFDKNQISVQGGILIKILEYRVKTGNFINDKKDFWKCT